MKNRIHTTIAILAVAAAVPFVAVAADRADERTSRAWEGFSDRHDVDGDGQVTRQELAETIDIFDSLDLDDDGVVSEADFDERRTLHAFGLAARQADEDRDRTVTPAEWDLWFAARDSDNDGALTADDWADGSEGPRGHRAQLAEILDFDGDGSTTRADFAALAARYDEDGDGALERGELPRVRHHAGTGHHGRRGGHGHAGRLDANNDGVVTRAEWDEATAGRDAARSAARFERMDTNRDGILSGDEINPWGRPGRLPGGWSGHGGF